MKNVATQNDARSRPQPITFSDGTISDLNAQVKQKWVGFSGLVPLGLSRRFVTPLLGSV